MLEAQMAKRARMTFTALAWLREPRWLLGILAFVTFGTLLWGLIGPEPRIIVARETTFITEPLRPDGMPDYPRYVRERIFTLVPPEDNAAVAVLHATWPMGLTPTQLAAVCKALGIPKTAPDVERLVDVDRNKILREEVAVFLGACAIERGETLLSGQDLGSQAQMAIHQAKYVPWKSAECPPLGSWLSARDEAIELVVAGSQRPSFEVPMPAALDTKGGDLLLLHGYDDIMSIRAIAGVLLTRAMLHVGEGRATDAWRDIHAVYRLSRLLVPVGSNHLQFTVAVAAGFSKHADNATLVLLDSPSLPLHVLKRVRRDLDALPPLADISSSIVTERLFAVEMVAELARMTRSQRAAVFNATLTDRPPWVAYTSLDMNVVLREVNSVHDQTEAAARIVDPRARRPAMEKVQNDFRTRWKPPSLRGRMAEAFMAVVSKAERSIQFADFLLKEVTSGIPFEQSDAAATSFDLVRIAAALAEYRCRGVGGEGKPYPDSLDNLVPGFMAVVPGDVYSGKPLRYERRGDGYLLYSVGYGGVDNGGTNHELDNGDWRAVHTNALGFDDQDIVVRMPRSKRTIIPRNDDTPP
jgi:hypothetical protein